MVRFRVIFNHREGGKIDAAGERLYLFAGSVGAGSIIVPSGRAPVGPLVSNNAPVVLAALIQAEAPPSILGLRVFSPAGCHQAKKAR